LSRYNALPALLRKEAGQPTQLTHCVTIPTEALLRVINKPEVFSSNPIQAHMNDFEKEGPLHAVARYGPKIANLEGF
jgi:hypothetical protein